MAASSSSQSGEQQYSLRWNDFHSSILNSFRHLRDEEDFVDVTLACDNNRSFTAHKVVLSACSPYFRKLLKANPCQHPIIILRDVPASDMESLLRFMYHGEVHVSQDQLGAFLKTAQLLHVRGLADVNCGVNAKIPLPSSSAGNNDSAPATPRNTWQDNGREDAGAQSPPEKRSRSYSPALSNHVEPSSKSDLQESLLGQALEGGPTIHTVSLNNVQAQSTCDSSLSEDEDISNNESILHSVKAEPNDMMNDMEHRNTFPAALLSLQGNMQGILSGAGPSGIHSNPTDSSYVRRGMEVIRVRATDPRPCPKCGKIYRSAHTLRTHLEDKHTICPGYRCVLCGTVAKSRNSLHSHMSRQHRGISTKDLPVLQMPSPFDPELASRLFAKAGIKISAAELRARASPTGPRRNDVRLELPRGSAPSEAGSSICGGDDPEDLTLPLSLRYNSSTPNNTVITKVSGSSSSKPSTATAIAAKSLDTMHGSREPNIAPLHPTSHHPSHEGSVMGEHMNSALLETYLQLIAENTALSTIGSQHAAMAHVAKMQINMNKHGNRSLMPSSEEYPMIGRDEEARNTGVIKNEDRQDTMHDRQIMAGDLAETSGGEDEEYSESEEPDMTKAE